jgi:hypothetical protein
MHPRGTIILGLIALVLAAYVSISEREELRKSASSEMSDFFTIRGFSITSTERITLSMNNEKALIIKEGDRWKVKNSKEFYISNQSVDDLFKIFRFGFVRIFEPDASSKLVEYGLDKPEINFEIKLKNTGSMKLLALGKDHVNGLTCYARITDEPNIFLVGKEFKNELIRFIEGIENH